MTYKSTNPPGLGFEVESRTCQVMNRFGAAVVAGDVLVFDLFMSETETSDLSAGASTSGLANVTGVDATDITGARSVLYCVALTAGADNAEITVQYTGRCRALMDAATDIGDELMAVAAGVDLVDHTATNITVAICAETVAAAGLAEVILTQGLFRKLD